MIGRNISEQRKRRIVQGNAPACRKGDAMPEQEPRYGHGNREKCKNKDLGAGVRQVHLLFQIVSAHQPFFLDAEKGAQRLQVGGGRCAQPAFPFGNGAAADIDIFCECSLRKSLFFVAAFLTSPEIA